MYTIQPRLQIYTNLLGSYDLTDKYKYSKIKFDPIFSIKIQYSSVKLTNKNLPFILFQEFATTQRFYFFRNKKVNLLKKFYVTLRNSCLYYYVEFLTNSNLLITKLKKKIHSSYNMINSILNINIINFYINFLNEKIIFSTNLNKIKIDLNWKNKTIFLSKLLLYYYIF